MADSGKDKIIAGVLIAVIVIAIGVFAYYNLPKNGKEENGTPILTVSYGNENYTYTLSQLEKIDDFSGRGGYKTSHDSIKGVGDYTGVRMTKLLDEIGVTGDYKIQAVASDNYSVNYTIDEINGNVTIYDATGNETGTGGVTMILAYAENGNYNFDGGPLRIVYVDGQGDITSSKLWEKQVAEIKVIGEE